MTNADRVSEVYQGEIWSERMQQRLRARVDWMVANARGDVLDIGCSQGIATLLAARNGCTVHGVDVEADRIAYATTALEGEPEEVRRRVRFSLGDAAELDLPDAGFDTVLLGEVIEHLHDPVPVLATAARVLRPDGLIVLTTPFGYSPHHDHQHTFYPASLLELVAPLLTAQELDVVDGYLRLLAGPGPMSAGQVARHVHELQPRLQEHLLATERGLRQARRAAESLRGSADEAAALRTDLEASRRTEDGLRDRLAAAQYRAQYATWRLAALRTRRWYRAAQAVVAARTGRAGLARMPRALLAASRPMARPAPPQRVDDQSSGIGPVAVPEITWPDGPVNRPDLRVATILDPFSAMAFRYEWQQLQPRPQDWRDLFAGTPPDLLFVESAWRGNDGAWSYAMSAPDAPKPALRELVAWCRERGIPTVFWNKEDPPNYDRFIATARLFDHVFTVDAGLLPRYRRDLGHHRVGVLPFAAQPRVHNPTSVPGGRVHDVAFAGTYFAEKHPGRREQMRIVLEPAREFGLHIFSRMGDGDSRYAFPEEYRKHVVGSLPYEQMLAAYRMYRVFLNVNSVTGSATMCARRIFELSACRTPLVSGPSQAITATFGEELVPTTTSTQQTRQLLAALLANPELRDRQAHLAQRHVFAEHTFAHRVDAVLATVGLPVTRRRPSVSVLLPTNRPEQIDHAIAQVARQRYTSVQLVMVVHGDGPDPAAVVARAKAAGIDDAVVLAAAGASTLGSCLNLALQAADGDLLAKMDDDNLYGEHYLSDLVPAFDYTEAGIVGKWAHYVHLSSRDATLLRFARSEHSYTDLVQGGTILARGDLLRELRFDDIPRAVDTTLLRRARAGGTRVYAADRFSYVSMRAADPSRHTWPITDLELLRSGRVAFYGDPTPHVLI